MLDYKYETHCHTMETSACSRLPGAELVRFYHKLGYAGIFVTDHFFNGNTTVPRSGLDWEERVSRFTAGYQNALAEGKALGLDVFFAWEYSYRGTDYLTYGLDESWLLAHPEVMDWSLTEYLDRVRAEGAFVIHAHPFRIAGYIPMINLLPGRVDGVEVDNASMLPAVNRRAEWYVSDYTEYNLYRAYGSDMHYTARPRLAGMAFPERLESVGDFISKIKEGSAEGFSLDIPEELQTVKKP